MKRGLQPVTLGSTAGVQAGVVVKVEGGEGEEGGLEGRARLRFQDGSSLIGYFSAGVLHGFCRYFDQAGRLTFLGHHRDGRPVGRTLLPTLYRPSAGRGVLAGGPGWRGRRRQGGRRRKTDGTGPVLPLPGLHHRPGRQVRGRPAGGGSGRPGPKLRNRQ